MPAIGPIKLAKRTAAIAAIMRDVEPMGPLGFRKGQKRSDPQTAMRGTSAAYLAARIKRDRPDIAARVEAGEFASMSSAAVAAGILKTPGYVI